MSAAILIHGGVHGAWCWERVTGPLQNAGHHVQAIDLPGRGASTGRASEVTLEDWVGAIGAAVAAAPQPPVLVAHSMGGGPSSQFAQRDPDAIAGIVYVSALVPADGQATLPLLFEAGPECRLLDEGAIVVAGDGKTATVAPEAARAAFYGRCSQADADAAIARLCPEIMAPMMTPLSLGEAFGSVRKHYIGASDDAAIPPAFGRDIADRCGAQYEQIDADHSPFFSAPERFTEMLLARL